MSKENTIRVSGVISRNEGNWDEKQLENLMVEVLSVVDKHEGQAALTFKLEEVEHEDKTFRWNND